MDGKSESYYKRDRDGEAPYMEDLLSGKIRIYDVPPEHRLMDTYIYAMRWARDSCGEEYSYTEKKLIEHFLLSDIIETYRRGDFRFEQLYRLYGSYFHPEGVNIFNGVGVDSCVWTEESAKSATSDRTEQKTDGIAENRKRT